MVRYKFIDSYTRKTKYWKPLETIQQDGTWAVRYRPTLIFLLLFPAISLLCFVTRAYTIIGVQTSHFAQAAESMVGLHYFCIADAVLLI